QGYRIGVPMAGTYYERINTDSEHYGGSNVGNGPNGVVAEQLSAHGREWSLNLTLPPLAAMFLEWVP
ncbi:MAG: alpha amylase C-terminal domain-containing protein, partial [Candidatus Accumulibacter sp.]|nr:alpha amylase C-terminal domain-containing protein [Accumulibacter sp.]